MRQDEAGADGAHRTTVPIRPCLTSPEPGVSEKWIRSTRPMRFSSGI